MARPSLSPLADYPGQWQQSSVLARAAVDWLSQLEATGSRSSVQSLEVVIGDLRRWFGAMGAVLSPAGNPWIDLSLRDFSAGAVQTVIRDLSAVYSPGSVRRTVSTVRTFVMWMAAGNDQRVDAGWDLPRRDRPDRPAVDVDVAVMCDVAGQGVGREAWPARDVVIVEALGMCGMTVDELCRLEADDVTDGLSVGRPPRDLTDVMSATRWAAYRKEREAKFPGVDGGRWLLRHDGSPVTASAVRALLLRITREMAADPVSPADLRAGAIRGWLAGGVPVAEVARRAGLATWAAVERYAPPLPA